MNMAESKVKTGYSLGPSKSQGQVITHKQLQKHAFWKGLHIFILLFFSFFFMSLNISRGHACVCTFMLKRKSPASLVPKVLQFTEVWTLMPHLLSFLVFLVLHLLVS